MNRSEYKAMVDKFNGLTTALEAETKQKYICLENPFTSNLKLDDITKEYLFKLSHLILQKKHYNPADKFGKKVRKVSENWMGGGTQCGNTIWYTFMFPKMSEIDKLIKEKKWSQAFGSIMGLFLYLNCNTNFISDHEIELDCMSGWFSQFSDFWLEILQQSDKVLGLDCGGGLPGGYRAPLLTLLKKQQRDLNNELSVYDEGMMEEYECEGDPPTVAIFDKAGKLIGEAENEGENKENASSLNKKKGKEPAKKSNATVKTVSASTLKVAEAASTSSDAGKRLTDQPLIVAPAKKTATVTTKKTSAKKAKIAPVKPAFVQAEHVTRSGRKSKTVDRF